MIRVEEMSRGFGEAGARVRALERVSLDVPRGSVTGLLGPNGAGKTTLFRLIAGLLRPDAGRASVAGFDVTSRPLEARSRLGLLTEEPGLPDRLTPLWHVALHASLHGLSRAEALERAAVVLGRLGLERSIHEHHAGFSKGMRQRVALARALVHQPPVLLLDEPTAGLDIEMAAWVRETIRRRADDGCAVLMATHLAAEAEQLCDTIAILGRGRLLASGPLDRLRRREGLGARLVVRLTRPATTALETARQVAGANDASAAGDCLVIPVSSAAQAAVLVGAIGRALGAASVIEFRHEAAASLSLEELYRRIQREEA